MANGERRLGKDTFTKLSKSAADAQRDKEKKEGNINGQTVTPKGQHGEIR